MHVRVLFFGVLKDWVGGSALTIELPHGASVADLLKQLGEAVPASKIYLRGIAVSVNEEYATVFQQLHEGDEVGLLPPVSGGAPQSGSLGEGVDGREAGTTELTREPINAEKIIADAKRGEDGAVLVFDGIVRNETRGRPTLYLDYEAYDEMAIKQMELLAAEARSKFGVRHVTVIHRLGRLNVGETSVLIVVSSAHRAEAFAACRWVIDTLKKTVPIWKKETFADGAVWAAGEPFPEEIAAAPAEAPHEQ